MRVLGGCASHSAKAEIDYALVASPETKAVTQAGLRRLLEEVREGQCDVEAGLERLAQWPERSLGHSRLDLQREVRCGHPEVVYGAGKTPEQLVELARAILSHHDRLLVTRVKADGAEALQREVQEGTWSEEARCFTVGLPDEDHGVGLIVVASAGTSDGPVAEEAAITARMLGAKVQRTSDIGVAGLHRLLGQEQLLRKANVLIVVAGMEGALPSVIGGLVDRPVIAVPTSVGYGASFDGLAALLAMLNSCAAGISVVNIDNGFGAGYSAALINSTTSK